MAMAFAVAAAVLVITYWLIDVFLAVFLAILLAILLDWLVTLIRRIVKLPRTVALATAALILIVGVAVALTLIAIPLFQQGNEFVRELPNQLSKLESEVGEWRSRFPWLNRVWPTETFPALSFGSKEAPELAKKAIFTLSKLFDFAGTALATFFLGFFLALNPEACVLRMAELWPGGGIEDRISLLRRLAGGLRGYLFTLAIYVLAMGVAWTVGLWIIGIPYPLLFGAIGGLVEIVPYVGPLLGLVPPLLMAVAAGPAKVLYVVLLYGVLHVVEGYLLIPFLMQRQGHVPPALVVLAVLVFGKLFGILGVVLAVPLATAGYVLVNETVYASRRKSEMSFPDKHAGAIPDR